MRMLRKEDGKQLVHLFNAGISRKRALESIIPRAACCWYKDIGWVWHRGTTESIAGCLEGFPLQDTEARGDKVASVKKVMRRERSMQFDYLTGALALCVELTI